VATILALALAAAVYPQLLAVVVVILTRPEPRRLLWACYFGALTVSLGCGVAVLLVFRDSSSVAGTSSHRLGASVYLVVGALAVIVAMLVASDRGRASLGARLPRVKSGESERTERSLSMQRVKSSAEQALHRGSVLVAGGVGLLLGIPGPFDLIAVGRLARGGYSMTASILTLIAFNLIKFALIEVPIVSYVVDRDSTAAWVQRFSSWMKENKVRVIAAVVAVIGLVLIGRGIARLG
jgi:Sap, sulfolipid-1-addressing protein